MKLLPGLALPALLLVACGQPDQRLEIRFEARYQGKAVSCQAMPGEVALSDLRFFVHDLAVSNHAGELIAATPDVQPGWQSADVALVDLEDGTGSCVNGSTDMHATVSVLAPAGPYRGLTFSMSVPESLNHGDPLLAESPLTQSAMHWHWRSGYKFLRAGVVRDDDGAWMHLGSARCAGVIGRLSGCDAGNRPVAEITDFVPDRDIVVVELSHLFQEQELVDGSVRSCQMGPDEAACDDWLPALGLDENGIAVEPASLFLREHRQ